MDPRVHWEKARTANAGVELSLEAFAARLQTAVGPNEQERIDALDHAGLYLAQACLTGQPAALRLLEQQHLSRLPRALERFVSQGVAVEDLVQELRVKLLGAGGAVPKLASFNGRGSLHRWLEAIAVRAAIDARRVQRDDEPLSEQTQDALVTSGAARASLKAGLREPFGRAVKASLSALNARDRRVLELHYLHGLTTSRIATIYQTHRMTVSRWLVAARAQILTEVEQALGQELATTRSEVGSIFRLLRSELSVSLPRLLDPSRRGVEE